MLMALLMSLFCTGQGSGKERGGLLFWWGLCAAGSAWYFSLLGIHFLWWVLYFYVLGLFIPFQLADKCVKLFGVLSPVVRLLSFFVPPFPEPAVTDSSEEAIRELVDHAADGPIDEEQKKMLENVFDLSDTDTEEICTHRSQVVSLGLDETAEDWEKTILANRHTFFPVVAENNEDVTGILDARDYFRTRDKSIPALLKSSVTEPLFVTEVMMADDVFALMQEKKQYFAVVLDEYGGMTGIVTLHDLMEALVGQMDEPDEVSLPESVVDLGNGTYELYGLTPLDEAAEVLGLDLPEEDYDTFGGYVLGTYGFIPADGTQLEIDLPDLVVQVYEVKDHRIGRMHVRKKGD